jgi:hypothetical protein
MKATANAWPRMKVSNCDTSLTAVQYLRSCPYLIRSLRVNSISGYLPRNLSRTVTSFPPCVKLPDLARSGGRRASPSLVSVPEFLFLLSSCRDRSSPSPWCRTRSFRWRWSPSSVRIPCCSSGRRRLRRQLAYRSLDISTRTFFPVTGGNMCINCSPGDSGPRACECRRGISRHSLHRRQ